jgi:hypothetical protein
MANIVTRLEFEFILISTIASEKGLHRRVVGIVQHSFHLHAGTGLGQAEYSGLFFFRELRRQTLGSIIQGDIKNIR